MSTWNRVRYKLMFYLREKRGLTYQRIGDIFGVSRQHVYQILHGYPHKEKK